MTENQSEIVSKLRRVLEQSVDNQAAFSLAAQHSCWSFHVKVHKKN